MVSLEGGKAVIAGAGAVSKGAESRRGEGRVSRKGVAGRREGLQAGSWMWFVKVVDQAIS
jgi:hypothetical protein